MAELIDTSIQSDPGKQLPLRNPDEKAAIALLIPISTPSICCIELLIAQPYESYSCRVSSSTLKYFRYLNIRRVGFVDSVYGHC
jgi:hypothetical protein